MAPGLRRVAELGQSGVVERNAVAPQRSPGRQQPLANRAGQLRRRPPASLGDLGRVLRRQHVGISRRGEDVRHPRHRLVGEAKHRLRSHEVALQLDGRAQLLEALADDALDEVLADLDASAGRPPDARLEVRLADQREPVPVRDEQRDVVAAARAVRDERELRIGDLALPPQDGRLAVALADGREHRFVDVRHNRARTAASPSGPSTTRSAADPSSAGPSSDATAMRTASSRPSRPRKASRSVVSSPA